MTSPALGVCYYPEHWPEDWWDADARRMAEIGLTYVRIGEFAWSRLAFPFDDRAGRIKQGLVQPGGDEFLVVVRVGAVDGIRRGR